MKTCKGCGLELPVDQFNRHKSTKDKLNPKCRACQKLYYTEYYKGDREQARLRAKREELRAEIRRVIAEAKDVPCADCGGRFPPYVMDFDHLRDKSFNIGSEASRSTIKSIRQEIAKCEVVCSNCHRERTWQRQNDESTD